MNKHIIIIEDERHGAELLKIFLEEFKENQELPNEPYIYTVIDKLEDAREKLSDPTFAYDIILSDGDIIGGHTRDILHLMDPKKLVVVTASTDYYKEVQEKNILVIYKPVMESELLTALLSILQSPIQV